MNFKQLFLEFPLQKAGWEQKESGKAAWKTEVEAGLRALPEGENPS